MFKYVVLLVFKALSDLAAIACTVAINRNAFGRFSCLF